MKNFRLTIIPALEAGAKQIEFQFDTVEEMEAAVETSSRLLLFLQDDLKVMDDYSNIFLKEKWNEEEQDWESVEEDEDW